jgi:hypothetical protein
VKLRVDHVVPRSWGGPDDIGSYQTLCEECNSGKSNTDWADFRSRTLLPPWMEEQLRLTEEQRAAMQDIRADLESNYRRELGRIQEGLQTLRDAIRAEAGRVEERVSRLLTAEQKATLESVRQHRDRVEEDSPQQGRQEGAVEGGDNG